MQTNQIAGLALITADSVIRGTWCHVEKAITAHFRHTTRFWCDTHSECIPKAIYGWVDCNTLSKRLKAQVFSLAPLLAIAVAAPNETEASSVPERLKRLKWRLRSHYIRSVQTKTNHKPKTHKSPNLPQNRKSKCERIWTLPTTRTYAAALKLIEQRLSPFS